MKVGLSSRRCSATLKLIIDIISGSVSDPGHSRYGQHLTAAEVDDLVQPSDEALTHVRGWLAEHGIEEQMMKFSRARDWITLYLSVARLELLLRTEYSTYWHEIEDIQVLRAPEWSLPQQLHEHVDTIQPTNSFFRPSLTSKIDSPQTGFQRRNRVQQQRQKAEHPAEVTDINQSAEEISADALHSIDLTNLPANLNISQACNASAVDPICVRLLYGTLGYTPQAVNVNRMALTNYLGQFNNQTDLDLYLQTYRPDATGPATTFENVNIAGGINKQAHATPSELSDGLGREGNLDVQIMMGIAYPTPLTTYSTGEIHPPFHPDLFTPTNTNEPFLTWLQYMLALDDLPQVISTSYGDIEHTVPPAYAQRVCQAFAQLGARGVTLIHGTGDTGVGRAGMCLSNDNSTPPAREFLTSFPEACPYVTSVGATRGVDPEIVAYNDRNGFVSGGGFSKYFARPAYQEQAVKTYLATHGKQYEGLYNAQGRAYPDVAAQGYRIATVWNQTHYHVDGTSASAPQMAAVVALVNDALLAEGRPPMGFLNPWLYREGWRAFTDVTAGSTKGCNTSGWQAAEGWDAASGFGTPVSSTRSLSPSSRGAAE